MLHTVARDWKRMILAGQHSSMQVKSGEDECSGKAEPPRLEAKYLDGIAAMTLERLQKTF